MEKYFGAHKTFIANIDREWFFGDIIDSIIHPKPFVRINVVFDEFFVDIRTNVTMLLLI